MAQRPTDEHYGREPRILTAFLTLSMSYRYGDISRLLDLLLPMGLCAPIRQAPHVHRVSVDNRRPELCIYHVASDQFVGDNGDEFVACLTVSLLTVMSATAAWLTAATGMPAVAIR